MILGKIIGKASTMHFQFQVTSAQTRKFQFIQVYHAQYGPVLGQIMELERSAEEMIATCTIIGYKDSDGHIKGIRTPFTIGIEVLIAEDAFIVEIVKLDQKQGGYIGKLEGKDIKVQLDLQKILTKHLCVLAKSGAGKSYAVGCLIEEILERNVPILIIDPHGEYSSLKMPNTEEKETLQSWGLEPKSYSSHIQEYGDLNAGLRPLKLNEVMNSSELMQLLPIQLSNTQEAMLFSVIKDLTVINFDNIITGLQQLNSQTKWALIEIIFYLRNLQLFSANYTPYNELICPGKASIINLKGISPEIQEVIVYKLLKDLFTARKQEKVAPFFCILEEAHHFVPEKGFGRAKSSEIIRLISSEGRKFGLGLAVVSQRPALLQKSVLAQCSSQIILKVTNPNDLRAITASLEGITPETEDEIQNLPIGSALVCGVVDRPLVVNIRARRTQHGGKAVNMLGNLKDGENLEEQEFKKNVIQETKLFEAKQILAVIKPYTGLKDIELMAQKPIKVTTYLIPSIFVTCQNKDVQFNVLIDKIKGRIIIDPEKDHSVELENIQPHHHFLRKPIFEPTEYDQKLDERISSESLKQKISLRFPVIDIKECFILYHKVALA